MALEKILIVNDDTEDVLAMRARLPDNLDIVTASQWQARRIADLSGFDLVVIDNDANNLQEAKGQETLENIRNNNSTVPIIYTSFQPGWVDGRVFQTQGVEVVRTDQALDRLVDRFGIEIRKIPESNAPEPEINLILTYNPIDGYPPGIYSNGRLILVAHEKNAQIRAREVLAEHVRRIYHDFDWKNDRELIRNIFVYDGINGGEIPGQIAQSLGHDVRMRVNLMACECDWNRKQRLANSSYVNLYQVECGGSRTLGAIADKILEIRRPGVDYNKLVIPPEKIIEKAERFELR